MVDMNAAVCPGDECRAARGDRHIYRDSRHLDLEFVESLTGALSQRLKSRAPELP
jgi:hypothetical protein